MTHLSQIRLLYDMPELSLRRPSYHRDPDSLSRLEVSKPGYDTCVLGKPRRFPDLNRVIRQVMPDVIESWAKVRILKGGDTIHATSLLKRPEDKRDQTYVRYEAYVDIYRHQRRRKPKYELQVFYGRLEHIFAFEFNTPAARAALKLKSDTTIVLAAIRTCAITGSDHRLDIHYYSRHGELSVIDIPGIQCAVGRVPDSAGGGWGIVDRSGSLARAIAVGDDEEH
uniref:Malate dehydrogenase (EC) n=1 Tax=Ganoderma boninense TaxID=34458 RepID=A0A5K1K4G6_9APHY|nr:Malate dehydrogenase (EC [Ganoderma boninense]